MPGIEDLLALVGGGMGGPPAPGGMPQARTGMPNGGMPPEIAGILQALQQVGAQAAMEGRPPPGGGGKMNAMAQDMPMPMENPGDPGDTPVGMPMREMQRMSEPALDPTDFRNADKNEARQYSEKVPGTRGYGDEWDRQLDQRMQRNRAQPPDDEAMLSAVQDKMGTEEKPDTHEWEGEADGVPTQKDLKYMEEYPTDGVIAAFVGQFPTWADQNNIQEGGKGVAGEGDYALSEEDKEEIYSDRKTRIDER